MRKGSSIIGLKVVSQAARENELAGLGTVKDLVFDHETDEVLALVLSEKDLFGLIDAQVVPWGQITSIGADAVIVASPDSRIAAHTDPRVKAVMNRDTVLSGTKIYTSDGRDLGSFADLYVDDVSGRITGYEISGGFVADTMSGKRFMAAPQEINIARDVAIVPPAVADALKLQQQQEPGGLHGAAATVGEKVGGAYDAARAGAADAYANLAGASVEKQQAFVIGKVASRDVVLRAADGSVPVGQAPVPAEVVTPTLDASSPNPAIPTASEAYAGASGPASSLAADSTPERRAGVPLVRQGETITAAHAAAAAAAGELWQLVTAAGGGAASDTVASARDNVSTAATGASATVAGLGATVQQKAEAAALGKPAGREVLAPNGSVLVAPGMIITEPLLEQARGYGKAREVVAAAGLGAASQGVDSVKETAGNLWETLKHKAAELAGATSEHRAEMEAQMEEAKIKGALGRLTDRVILDKADHVILNAGAIITHAAIDQARAADVLDILLDSVSSADPEITPAMLRARDRGQASIPSAADGNAEASPAAAPGHQEPDARPAGASGA